MDNQTAVEILNELLASEQRSLPGRLLEATMFVARPLAGAAETVRQMAEQSREHAAWLTGAILELDGTPGPRFGDPTSADLHYQEFPRLIPRLVREHEALIRRYSRASERLAAEPQAGAVVSRILARHREHLGTLQQLTGSTAGDPTA